MGVLVAVGVAVSVLVAVGVAVGVLVAVGVAVGVRGSWESPSQAVANSAKIAIAISQL